MPDHLFILLGAGASFDCASHLVVREGAWRPPLTRELFESRFSQTLNTYPLAEAVAADIQPAMEAAAAAEEPIVLEQFLREELRDSPHAHRRQQFRAVPLYLQHLLFNCSAWDPPTRGYTNHPDNYNRLISVALELPEAVFITLNYDTLLDRRLFSYAPLVTMDSYINPETSWSLIKLHGSVDWGYLVQNDWEIPGTDPYLATTFATLGDKIKVDDSLPILRLAADVRGLRQEGLSSAAGGRLYYPALSAPLGPGDELVCPPDHIKHLRERLRAYEGLNLLVIGYSGLDQEVLKLFQESGNHLKSLTIVTNSEDSAITTQQAITGAIGLGGRMDVRAVYDGFDSYATSGELGDRIRNLL